MSTYGMQVIEHYKIQGEVALQLLEIAQRLCPGTWVLQVRCNYDGKSPNGVQPRRVYEVCVTNGDDNVTASNANLGAALSQMIYYLLNGSVFPLTGGGGMYVHPLDCGYIRREGSELERSEDEHTHRA